MNPDPDELEDLDDDPLAADDDTFEDATGTTGSSEDDFDDFDDDPVVVGLFRGHVADCKWNPKKPNQLIVEVVSEEVDSRGSKVLAFLDRTDSRQKARLRRLATYLGVPTITKPEGGWRLQGGVAALKNRAGLFVADTYQRDDGSMASSLCWGMPKPGKSKDWDAYVKASNFNEKQVQALKDSPGVINPKHASLFD